MIAQHPDWLPVATDGSRIIYAEPGDNPNRQACVFDPTDESCTDSQGLQVWFKWGVWQDMPAGAKELTVQFKHRRG